MESHKLEQLEHFGVESRESEVGSLDTRRRGWVLLVSELQNCSEYKCIKQMCFDRGKSPKFEKNLDHRKLRYRPTRKNILSCWLFRHDPTEKLPSLQRFPSNHRIKQRTGHHRVLTLRYQPNLLHPHLLPRGESRGFQPLPKRILRLALKNHVSSHHWNTDSPGSDQLAPVRRRCGQGIILRRLRRVESAWNSATTRTNANNNWAVW